jgi:hypothetical protein
MTFVGTAIALLFKLLGLWEFSPDLYVGFGIQIPRSLQCRLLEGPRS